MACFIIFQFLFAFMSRPPPPQSLQAFFSQCFLFVLSYTSLPNALSSLECPILQYCLWEAEGPDQVLRIA